MRLFPKSDKLEHVCYDIRGPVHKEALRLEEEGNKILKLNIGNPAPFGFEAPDEILVDVLRNLPSAQRSCGDAQSQTGPHRFSRTQCSAGWWAVRRWKS